MRRGDRLARVGTHWWVFGTQHRSRAVLRLVCEDLSRYNRGCSCTRIPISSFRPYQAGSRCPPLYLMHHHHRARGPRSCRSTASRGKTLKGFATGLLSVKLQLPTRSCTALVGRGRMASTSSPSNVPPVVIKFISANAKKASAPVRFGRLLKNS